MIGFPIGREPHSVDVDMWVFGKQRLYLGMKGIGRIYLPCVPLVSKSHTSFLEDADLVIKRLYLF